MRTADRIVGGPGVDEADRLAVEFQRERHRLTSIAYRILGSVADAEDAVQGTWLRLDRADSARIDNLGGWLTTAVGRECLDMLRRQRTRRHDATLERLADPVVDHLPDRAEGPEAEAITAEAVGLALLVVLDELSPVERVAFVLHDVFAVPYEEIAPIVRRTTETTRQLASRARRRVQRYDLAPDRAVADQREIVEAFIAAARAGDIERLILLLDPDVLLRADVGAGVQTIQGAATVAQSAAAFAPSRHQQVGMVNGGPGIIATDARGRVVSIMSMLVAGHRIVGIAVLADINRLQRLFPNDSLGGMFQSRP
jgi:RNA polymerase sigma factor (sigma-70 family)